MQNFFIFLIVSAFCFVVAANDYYSVLRVSPESSQKEIKDAYKRLQMKFHPDRQFHPNSARLSELQAEVMIKRINEAYSVLSDPTQRHFYDEGLKNVDKVTISEALKKRMYGEITAEEYRNIFREHINSLSNSLKTGEITLREYKSNLMEYKIILTSSFRNREITFMEYASLLREHKNNLRTRSDVITLGIGQTAFGAMLATNLMADDITLVGFAGGYLMAMGAVNLCAEAFKYKKEKE